MSWFEYGSPRRRGVRRGVYLRIATLPENILKLASAGMHNNQRLTMVEVEEILPKGKVIVRFWCRTIGDERFDRYTVFSEVVSEDPAWACESDIGRGYKE